MHSTVCSLGSDSELLDPRVSVRAHLRHCSLSQAAGSRDARAACVAWRGVLRVTWGLPAIVNSICCYEGKE
ncbi:hypothetical protein E2C01_007116 [Portunus trituberculatus]|uniref:Uncharacterized protein n=1 Tax=Portunus trituberculatus TaxID=210409 RepID=A0A5B7D3M2_PORTR|nr:hypothetical protein [Portunus trituberculatus]